MYVGERAVPIPSRENMKKFPLTDLDIKPQNFLSSLKGAHLRSGFDGTRLDCDC
jgi:hypothetical protein